MIDMMEQLTEETSQKVVKCILLKNHYWLITEIEELRVDYELNSPNCKLVNPYQIDQIYNYMAEKDETEWEDKPLVKVGNTQPESKYEIYHWKEFTNDNEVLIFSEYLVTIVDPKPELLEAYLQATE